MRKNRVPSLGRKDPLQKEMATTPVFLPGKFLDIPWNSLPGQRSWVGCSPVQFSCSVVTPWTAACQTSLSIINSQSLLRLMPIESVMPSNLSPSVVPFSSHLQSSPASGSFPVSQLFTPGGQSIGASSSASVLPTNIQDWFPLGWTFWISLQPVSAPLLLWVCPTCYRSWPLLLLLAPAQISPTPSTISLDYLS